VSGEKGTDNTLDILTPNQNTKTENRQNLKQTKRQLETNQNSNPNAPVSFLKEKHMVLLRKV